MILRRREVRVCFYCRKLQYSGHLEGSQGDLKGTCVEKL